MNITVIRSDGTILFTSDYVPIHIKEIDMAAHPKPKKKKKKKKKKVKK